MRIRIHLAATVSGICRAAAATTASSPRASTVGGAIGGSILGGILGGVLTGRAGGAAVGAIIGGATGAAIGAQAEQRNGYYLYQGACYYRYPTGEYAVIDPGYCN